MSDAVEIPKECKAGVVVNEGPNFTVEVRGARRAPQIQV